MRIQLILKEELRKLRKPIAATLFKHFSSFGQTSPLSRPEKLFRRIRVKEQRGLEIGALDKPCVQPDQGDIRYVDFATTEALRVHHAIHTPTVDTSKLVAVHYVWGKESLRQCVGNGVFFDYVVASHVLEHVPDLITWLQEIAEILKPGGVLSVIVPDKRYTFDRLRPMTQMADLIEAYLEKRRRPSLRQIFEYLSLHASVDAAAAWAGNLDDATIKRVHDDAYALQRCEEALRLGTYFDAHCWVFIPSRFFELLRGLFQLRVIPLRVAEFFDTAPGEIDFFVTLERMHPEMDSQLLLRSQLESLPILS